MRILKILRMICLNLLCCITIHESVAAALTINNADTGRYIISGRVYDAASKQGLPGVSVGFNSSINTVTNYDGMFSIKLPQKYAKRNFSILVTLLEYETKKVKVQNRRNKLSGDLNVYLKHIGFDMKKVVIIQ